MWKVTAPFVFCAIVFLFSSHGAHAYSIEGTGTISGSGSTGTFTQGSFNFEQSLSGLSSPFQNFIDSMKGIGSVAVRVNPQLAPNSLTGGLETFLNDINNWFYSTFGFRISDFFLAILNIFAWVLGLATAAVNWLLGLFK
jgi:hypothetical protein